VEGIIQGILDVAAMGRRPTDDESGQIEFVSLGWGAEVPITHADVGVTSLTTQELVAIFSGQVTNWSEVGGPDLDIIVYVRGSDTVHTKVIREHVLGDVLFTEMAQIMGGLGDMTAAVETTPGSVGYANYPGVVGSGVDVQAIAVDGFEHDNLGYLAVLELGIGYLPERQSDVQPLIDWLLSDSGQSALREAGMMIK
jgi:phosphate transport system substrate-binding protein